MSIKRLLLAFMLVLGTIFGFMAARSDLLPPRAYAQGAASSTIAVYSGTTAVSPGSVVAAATNKKIYVEAVTITLSTTGCVSLCSTTAGGVSTPILTIPCLAGVPTTLNPAFFTEGGVSAAYGTCKTAASCSLTVQQASNTAVINASVRYNQN